MAVGVLIRKTLRFGVPIARRQLASRGNEPSGRNFRGSTLRQRSQTPNPSGRGFGGNTLRCNPPPRPRQKLPGHSIAPFKRGGRSSFPLPSRPTLPHPPQPPRSPLRQYLDASRRINDKLEQIKRGFNDIAFPGLNEASDFLSDQIIRFVKEL
ncbi:hypothetical protein [Microseira sp. BLCC-F43]|uniref:hypothetical protein n=1 Tax=Microseira sp. BLCC-F43 TaxID=3153602 RepID=UPI0035B71110